jgi:uncharacterized protein (DUF1778 family)
MYGMIHTLMTGEAKNAARFEARITEEQKALFLRTAELSGRSLTDFVLASAQETAARALREHQPMRLALATVKHLWRRF